MALILGENAVTDHTLFERLLLYLSQSERDLITTALQEDLLHEDRDELVHLLEHLNVTTHLTQENLKAILIKVAHKQLIQKPRYATGKMSLVANHFLREAFGSPEKVLQMYEDTVRANNKKAFEVAGCISYNSSRAPKLSFSAKVHRRTG